MNSAPELLERLLKLFPVKTVKAQFDVEGTQAEVIPAIVAANSAQAIKDFVIDKIGLTKQHSYVFALKANFNRSKFVREDLPMEVISELHQKKNYIFTCLPVVEYEVALLDPYDQFTVQFYQPTRIVVREKELVIQTTIMERSASAYIPRDKERRMLDIAKRNTEEVFIANILSVFKQHHAVELCDLNKGVKAIWDQDLVDCTSVKYRKDKSTSSEAMDEQYTVKAHMPEVYQDIITRPLNKMVFRSLKKESEFSRHFMVDPSKGEFSMATYPEDPEQTWKVINEILRNN